MMKQVWYGGYRANIITYTIAKFSNIVKKSGNFIDFTTIWKTRFIPMHER